jgi:hypothetical protein
MSIKSFDNLLEPIKEEIKADANAILYISRRALTRVDAALNAHYIQARVAICTVNSHFVYPVYARWANARSTLVI